MAIPPRPFGRGLLAMFKMNSKRVNETDKECVEELWYVVCHLLECVKNFNSRFKDLEKRLGNLEGGHAPPWRKNG